MSAAILSKFVDMLVGKDPEEIDEIEEYEEPEEVYERPARAGSFSRNLPQRDFEVEAKAKSQTKVLPMSSTVSSSKVVITQPECYECVEEIGEYLRQKKSVIVNLESVNKEDGRRILDFLSGAAFALEGDIQKVSSLIYLMTPKAVEIQNDVERAQYRSKLSFSWLK